MKKFILILLSSLWLSIGYAQNIYLHPLTSSNQSAFNKVQAQLSTSNRLSGEFKQIRKMKLLSTPLMSEGNFVLSKNNGLQWHQTKPFHSDLIVTPSKIEQKIENTPPTIITKKQQPIVFSFTNIFLSIFNGNAKAIKNYFKIYFIGNTYAWKIALKPLGSPLNKAILSIEMSGGKYVYSITINEVKQNQMILNFFNVKGS